MKKSLLLTYTILLTALCPFTYAADSTAVAPRDTATAFDTAVATSADSAAADTITAASTPAEEPQPAHPDESKHDLVVVREDLDTVFIFDKSVFKYVARDWRNNIDIFRQRGYGIGVSNMYGANAIFTEPIKDLAENDPYLAGKRFDFSRFAFEPFLVSGGYGFVGLGEGLRLGGGGMSGERKFTSNHFGGDSMLVLNTQLSYGGFLIEKCILKGKWNLSGGGTIGAGSFNVTVSEQTNTFFYGNIASDFDDKDKNSSRSVFFMLDPHAGFSYTIFYFLHIGGTISMPMFMSIEKFNAYTDDYFTVNPGFQIKFIFGNIG